MLGYYEKFWECLARVRFKYTKLQTKKILGKQEVLPITPVYNNSNSHQYIKNKHQKTCNKKWNDKAFLLLPCEEISLFDFLSTWSPTP